MSPIAFDAGEIQARMTIDDTDFNAKADAAKVKADELGGKDVSIKVTADTGDTAVKLAAVKAETDAVNDSSSKAKKSTDDFGDSIQNAGKKVSEFGPPLSAMTVGIAALAPLLPVVAGGVVAIGGAFAAAGAGAVGFGAVAVDVIKQATDANTKLATAQQAVNDATSSSARADALLKQKALIDSLAPSTIALGSAVAGLDKSWTSFASSFTPQVLGDVQIVAGLLPKLEALVSPTISAGSNGIATILTQLSTAVSSPGAASFFAWLAGNAASDIVHLADGVGDLAAGFGHLLVDFAPLETQLVLGFDSIAASFDKWSANLGGTAGFNSFMALIEKDGPLVVQTIADLGTTAGKLAGAFGGFLPYELQFADSVLDLINKYPQLAPVLAGMFTGFEALKIINTITGPLGTLVSIASTGATKLGLFAAAEGAVGDSAASATPEVVTLGGAIDTTSASGATLLGILGKFGSFAGLAALTGSTLTDNFGGTKVSVTGAGSDTATLENEIAQLNSTRGAADQLIGTPSKGGSTLTKQQAENLLQAYGIGPNTHDTFNDIDGGLPGDPTTTQSGTLLATGHRLGLPGDTTSGPSNTAPGGAAYVAPLTGGSGSVNTGPTSAQSLAALAALQGINLGQALLKGVQTGVSPLDSILSNISAGLGVKATAIEGAFQQVFDNAVQIGNAAAKSLQLDASTAGAGFGTATTTNVVGGKFTTSTANNVLAAYQNQLSTDSQFVNDIKQAGVLGVNSDIINQFTAAGPSSDATLRTLLGGGKSVISQVNSTDNQINALGTSYGFQVAQQQSQQQMVTLLQQLVVAVQQQGPAFAKALTTTATGAKLNAGSTPAKGVFTK